MSQRMVVSLSGYETVFVKSHEIWELYGVDVAVIVVKNGRYSTYRSMDKLGWPPSMADIVGHRGKANTE